MRRSALPTRVFQPQVNEGIRSLRQVEIHTILLLAKHPHDVDFFSSFRLRRGRWSNALPPNFEDEDCLKPCDWRIQLQYL